MTTTPSTPSLARLYRNIFYFKWGKSHWLTQPVKEALTQAVRDAEKGHCGEVVLVIEYALPVLQAYRTTCRDRAIHLFSTYRVWDTEDNTGILIYLNLCERQLEIVADRGIHQHVSENTWQTLCQNTTEGIKNNQPVESLQTLLQDIGEHLRTYHSFKQDPEGNELPDQPIYIS